MTNPNVVVYYNMAGEEHVKPDMIYLAYIVLPNGEYWNVRFNGATEEIARAKAIALWTKENEKWDKQKRSVDVIENYSHDDEVNMAEPLATNDPWSAPSGRGHHFAGKVWMRNPEGELKRVALTEIGLYEKNGFYRSGPRGK